MEPSSQEPTGIISLLFDKIWSFVIENTWPFLNTSFITALAGAGAGAWAATRIAERKENRRLLQQKVSNINAAITVAANISNTYCSAKKQFVRDFKDELDSHKKKFKDYKAGLVNKPERNPKPFELKFNLITIDPLEVPIEILKNILFEKIALTGHSLTLLMELSSSIQNLNFSIKERNKIIRINKEGNPSSNKMAEIYLGLPSENGHINGSFPDCVNAMSQATDDCIMFSKILCEELIKHGQALIESSKEKSLKIHNVDFTILEQGGLIPDNKQYQNWIDMCI